MGPAEAVSRLARGTTTRFDVGRAWDEYFVNSLGLGLDAAVAARVAQGGTLRGWGAYAAALVGAWRGFRPARWEVTVGDEHWDEEHLLIEVGIGPTSGGGFRLTPDARPDDGLLDVCAVRPIGLLRLLSIGPRVLWGGHRYAPEVRLRQAAALRIAAPGGRLLAHFDGEVRDPGRSVIDIVLEPRRLSVLLAG